MHFIRGWPWQPSWSRVVFGVSMSRGSSNKVVEQRSSSSNTTAPIDTPSGSLLTHTHTHTHTQTKYTATLVRTLTDIKLTYSTKSFKHPMSTFKQPFSYVEWAKCLHISIFVHVFSYSCVFAYSSLLTKKQNQAARKILRFLLRCRHRWVVILFRHPCTHNQGHTTIHISHTHLEPTATHAVTTLVLIVGVVLLFLWSPLMDHRPLKRVSRPSLFSLTLSPGGWCLFACQRREGERRSWNITLPSLSCRSSSLPSSLSLSLCLSSRTAEWCRYSCMIDR